MCVSGSCASTASSPPLRCYSLDASASERYQCFTLHSPSPPHSPVAARDTELIDLTVDIKCEPSTTVTTPPHSPTAAATGSFVTPPLQPHTLSRTLINNLEAFYTTNPNPPHYILQIFAAVDGLPEQVIRDWFIQRRLQDSSQSFTPLVIHPLSPEGADTEDSSDSLSGSESSVSTGDLGISYTALQDMSAWLLEHIDHPYPQPNQIRRWSKLGRARPERIRKWFFLKRSASQNQCPRYERKYCRPRPYDYNGSVSTAPGSSKVKSEGLC